MRIILKHTIKNMIAKPLRTIVLVVCIMVTAVAAYLMLDMTNSLSSIISNFFSQMVGSSDINMSSGRGLYDEDFEGVPEYQAVKITTMGETLYRKDSDYYSYVFQDDVTVFGLDVATACNMGIFHDEFTLGDREIAINDRLADTYRYEVGDTLTLHDKYGNTIDFTVKTILKEDSIFISKVSCSAVVNENAMLDLNASEDYKIYQMFVDVIDDNQIETFIDKIKENAPHIECENLAGNAQLKEAMAQMTSLFALIFIVAFMLVIFITVSLSNRIICERMSVIGTFRSLGISSRVTTFILLLENIIYGLVGAGLGTSIYKMIREPMMSSMVSLGNDQAPKIGPMENWMFVAVFVGAVIVECASPIFALTKAVRTAIRDIIFANKDTEYVHTKRQLIFGAVLLVIGIACGIVGTGHMVVLIIGMIALVLAMAMLIPYILKGASKLLVPCFKKLRMPVASLASTEISSKKSTVSSAVLSATAVSLTVCIFIVSTALVAVFSDPGYHADVVMLGASEETVMYDFVSDIEGVTDVDFIYSSYDIVEINGERKEYDFTFLALPKQENFSYIPNLPDSIGETEFMMNEKFAKQFGISVGDTVDITMLANDLFPIHKNLTMIGYVDTTNYDTSDPVLVINKDLYIEVYQDYPSVLLVHGENPDYIKDQMETHIFDGYAEFYTGDEFIAYSKEQGGSLIGMLVFLMALGVILTVIGTTGNQIIGFEGRKREYAVMYSTSMDRKKIARLIFLENMISTAVAVVVALCMSGVLMSYISRVLDTIDMSVEIQSGIGDYILAGLVFLVALMFTCLSPIRALKKMNIASELKYE